MLAVVYTAPNRPVADMLLDMLKNEGIIATLRPIGLPHLGASASVEMLVPESQAEEATEIINAFFAS
jgi:hypothetical protein